MLHINTFQLLAVATPTILFHIYTSYVESQIQKINEKTEDAEVSVKKCFLYKINYKTHKKVGFKLKLKKKCYRFLVYKLF